MIAKIISAGTILFAMTTLHAGYVNKSALVLRDSNSTNSYSGRSGTRLSGSYNSSGVWIINSESRSSYENFQGGGPGSGK
ncbi:hypothetical protein [Calothrix sp. NIES-3974]|uniref:hypothetical protein n=1 Tax=Calothrix sp. NIES-3974 TaxID=2005462 RepID=UPI000B5F369B|nr:hypothetical protein [Calothrix sp. NIES-3974]BAZ05604.1 hypothetical protein NIES3974_22550 [Calothrix sp. NIES-3974]